MTFLRVYREKKKLRGLKDMLGYLKPYHEGQRERIPQNKQLEY